MGKDAKFVKVHSSDIATGYLNRTNGELQVQTAYFESKSEDTEYGWSLNLNCTKTKQVF
jgi:hypothetical protein